MEPGSPARCLSLAHYLDENRQSPERNSAKSSIVSDRPLSILLELANNLVCQLAVPDCGLLCAPYQSLRAAAHEPNLCLCLPHGHFCRDYSAFRLTS